MKYACAGSSVTLPWEFILALTGETVEDVKWLYEGHSDEMVAIFAQGHFLPLPAFSKRVQYVTNAGLSLSHVTVGDSGNYTVMVTILGKDGTFQHLERTVQLEVRGLCVWCVFVFVCVCVCVCARMCVYVRVRVCMWMRVPWVWVCMGYMCTQHVCSLCLRLYFVSVFVCAHVCMQLECMFMRTCTRACMCVSACAFARACVYV